MHRACYCNACSIHPQISQKTFVSFPNELTALSFVILQRDLGAANIHPPRLVFSSGLGQTQYILSTLQHRCCVKCGDRFKEILFASNSFFLFSGLCGFGSINYYVCLFSMHMTWNCHSSFWTMLGCSLMRQNQYIHGRPEINNFQNLPPPIRELSKALITRPL